jgi:hypothetical protein
MASAGGNAPPPGLGERDQFRPPVCGVGRAGEIAEPFQFVNQFTHRLRAHLSGAREVAQP